MDTKLIAGLVCAAALALGACSGNNASGTTGGDGTGAGSGTNGGPDPTPLQTAETEYQKAQTAVKAAVDEARRAVAAGTEAARDDAERLIGLARTALANAVKAAEEAERAAAADGSGAQVGAAARLSSQARRLQSEQTNLLDRALDPLAWFGRALARQMIPRGQVSIPRDGTNTAMIERTPRTIPTSATDSTQKVNPDAFTSTTFKDVKYAAGDTLFSSSGDEFKVDGYIVQRISSTPVADTTIYTGLKLTDAGLVIRTGGTDVTALDSNSKYKGDFTDFRRDITSMVSDTDDDDDVTAADGLRGQNGWDLTIVLDEPQTIPVSANSVVIPDRFSSWTGNSAFYWRSLVPADDRQKSGGEYYAANAFNQPAGQENLGRYEVWLSNHFGVDTKLEPISGQTGRCLDGSRGRSCPSDDDNMYLKYAAYGLFVYTADTSTYLDATDLTGQIGRINTLYFGYSAFGTEDGQKTTDIGQAITKGKFKGYTLAYEVKGNQGSLPIEYKLLRGDVSLTVNIPKGSGSASLQGSMNNFQSWDSKENYWVAYTNNFAVTLGSVDISDDGTFVNGTATATPNTDLAAAGVGQYKGNFYGPRDDKNDLEVAGSWHVGLGTNAANKALYGSFGAKQKPPATPVSN